MYGGQCVLKSVALTSHHTVGREVGGGERGGGGHQQNRLDDGSRRCCMTFRSGYAVRYNCNEVQAVFDKGIILRCHET